MVKNVYIHIPFCKSKCKYCSFVSYTDLSLKDNYLDALECEIIQKYQGETLDTLYIGGGTPSLLKIDEIIRILSLFTISNNTEITMELNPESVNESYLKALKTVGINRISFGVQTFNDSILSSIGRRHDSKMAREAVYNARSAGFENISLDFIYGLPAQTIPDFMFDLKQGVALGVKHLSLYGLKIDEGCYFHRNFPKNLPDNDMQAEMYLKAIDFLEDKNFEHYEISNFSKQGFNSKHNLNYWNNNSYYGFGCAAHGYMDGIRYANNSDIEKYINEPCNVEYSHSLSPQEILEEEIFLGLRKGEGINTKKINSKFNIEFDKKYSNILNKFLKSGHLIETEDGYKFSNNGFLISNTIMCEFLD